jgi:uncharacterized protein
MHFAAKRDNVDMMRLLLHFKADVNARDLNGRTPLFYAAMLNHANSVAFLLSNMGSALAIDKQGNRIEDVTSDPEILRMIGKGKSVTSLLNNDLLVPSCDEIRTPW